MTKKRVTISIDEDIWEIGKEAAWQNRISLSRHIENLLRANNAPEKSVMQKIVERKPAREIDAKTQGFRNVVNSPEEIETFFKPVSKESQLGKKKK